ncbi:MAG: adenosylcobinamide-GDP ribazoletransferase [Chloroflexi bacterium]|nr:adenosylcobinamide-GDP ribazoletransferase [Chloroflexota bacterium]
MGFFTAWRFLTAIPLPLTKRGTIPETMGETLAYFPLVGLVIGLGLAGLDWGLGLVFPPSIVNALVVVALIVVTGALHMDGLMDTGDGLGSGLTREERLNAMRDSRVGAFGVIAAVCIVLIKYGSLEGLPESARTATLVLMPTLGRWAVVLAMFAFPSYARLEGLGRAFKEQATLPRMLVATVFCIAATLALFGPGGLALMMGVGLTAIGLAFFLRRLLGGLSGDTYGAIVEASEAMTLVLAILIPVWSWR